MGDAPDDYERRYMDGDRALLRARQRMPLWVHGLVVGLIGATWLFVFPALRVIWQHREDPWITPVLVFLGALFALNLVVTVLGALLDHALRVVVTPSHLRVHRGLTAHDIPRAAITSVTAGDVRDLAKSVSLWGALARRHLHIAVPGVRRCLRVVWRDAAGRARVTLVTCDAADDIERALAGGEGSTGVRVEAGSEGDRAGGEAAEDVADAGVSAASRAR